MFRFRDRRLGGVSFDPRMVGRERLSNTVGVHGSSRISSQDLFGICPNRVHVHEQTDGCMASLFSRPIRLTVKVSRDDFLNFLNRREASEVKTFGRSPEEGRIQNLPPTGGTRLCGDSNLNSRINFPLRDELLLLLSPTPLGHSFPEFMISVEEPWLGMGSADCLPLPGSFPCPEKRMLRGAESFRRLSPQGVRVCVSSPALSRPETMIF